MQAKRAQDEGGHWSPCMTPHPVHARRAAELARGRPGHVAAAESKAKRCAARALCGSSASRRAGGGEAELVGSCALAGNVGQPGETCRILSRALAVDPFDRMRRVRRFGFRDCGFCFSRWAACILAQESGLFAFGLARKSILPMPRPHPTQAHPKAHAHIHAGRTTRPCAVRRSARVPNGAERIR
jgi:hypothetical protein